MRASSDPRTQWKGRLQSGAMGLSDDQSLGLAVETSGSQGSVAIGRGDTVLAEEAFDTCDAHSVALLPAVARLVGECRFAPQDVAYVYVSAGPGSFTGLRIGMTVARTLAYAVGSRVVCVPSLAVAAQNALRLAGPPARVAVLLDAKRRHVFAACFERRGDAYEALDGPEEREPAGYLEGLGAVAVLGEGVSRHADAIAACPRATVLPEALNAGQARVVYALGRASAARGAFAAPADLSPMYVRRPEAEERWDLRQSEEVSSGDAE